MEARLQLLLRPVLGGSGTHRPTPQHDALLARFQGGEVQALFCYIDENDEFCMSVSIPRSFSGRLLYLVREKPEPRGGGSSCATAIAAATPRVAAGYLDGGSQLLGQLHGLVAGLHLPPLQAAATGWPKQLRQDWAAALDTFCSALSEAVHVQRGATVLYVPEGELGDPAAAARQRELVQRLEVQLLHWTRQIRDLLSIHRSREAAMHTAGPAEEVQFWRLRARDLGSLHGQLDGTALGRVLRVLEAARSAHLPAFLSLRGAIAAEAEQAASNLAFLEALEEPCAALAAAQPAQLAGVLPGVLDVLRMVWSLAPHFGAPDQMAGMLRQVGNAVVACCRATLDLRSIFVGHELDAAVQRLEQCCAGAAVWRAAYLEAAQRVNVALPDRPWDFAVAGIFAHVEAFMQRCRDLQELCQAQQQFACGQRLTAVLGGTKAPEFVRAIGEVQNAFAQQMGRLQGLRYDVLDVRCSQWYRDMEEFRAAARSLDQMLGNILRSAVLHATCLAGKLDVIEAFARITTRDGLRKAVEARMSDWHQQFMGELAVAKQAFEATKADLPPGSPLPQHAGRVTLLRGLLRSIEHTWDHLSTMAGYIPVVPKAAESAAAYEALHMGLQQHINTLSMQWYGCVPHDLATHLQHNLLHQDRAAGGLLRVNLSPQLQAALEEGYLFERQGMGVPGAVQDLLPERQRLRALWVGAAQVSCAYNAVLGNLSADDRRLCRDRIRFLDRHVLPGVNKLSWGSPKHQAEFWQKDALRCCKDVAAAVAELKAASAAVARTCTMFHDALLLRVERKHLFDLPDFEQRQAAHQAAVRTSMCKAYAGLRTTLVALYRRFVPDSDDVQQEWLAYLRRADAQLLEALTACVRRSLHEMARALQGEHKGAEVSPVFLLSVILDTNGRVELKPTLQQLFDTVHGTCKAAVAVLEALPRLLPEVLRGCAAGGPLPACLREAESPPPFVEGVGRSEEAVTKPMQAITAGISGIVEKVQQLLTFHEKKYMTALWQTECGAYMRRYERANKPVASFLADIEKYQELKEEVLAEDSASNVRWLRLDASTLKQQLLTLCDNWVAAFTALLASTASRQLGELEAELGRHITTLTGGGSGNEATAGSAATVAQQGEGDGAQQVQPAGEQGPHREQDAVAPLPEAAADELAPAAQGPLAVPLLSPEQRQCMVDELEVLHGRLEGRREELQQQTVGVQEKYGALAALQVPVPDEEQERAARLPGLWAAFVAELDAVPARLRNLWG